MSSTLTAGALETGGATGWITRALADAFGAGSSVPPRATSAATSTATESNTAAVLKASTARLRTSVAHVEADNKVLDDVGPVPTMDAFGLDTMLMPLGIERSTKLQSGRAFGF